jgi:hypothetical protein
VLGQLHAARVAVLGVFYTGLEAFFNVESVQRPVAPEDCAALVAAAIRADRFALQITGFELDQSVRVMKITAALEGHEHDEDDIEFKIRLRAIKGGFFMAATAARAIIRPYEDDRANSQPGRRGARTGQRLVLVRFNEIGPSSVRSGHG